jgi:phosphatidylinositol dimannoside acyltransferase
MSWPRLTAVWRRLARHVADAWLTLLFFLARRHPTFLLGIKRLLIPGVWRCSPTLRKNTRCNARWLLGESSSPAQRDALGMAVVGNFYDFICDVGRSTGMSREQLLARIERIEGDENYAAARRAGKGAIVVTAHMGSFEVGMAALLKRERRVHVLFRRDAFGLFEKTRSTLRQRLGVIEACVDEGLPVWVRLREALAADEVVLIQGDRVLRGQKGRRVPFLGGHMLMPTGPVKLALATGAPIIPTFTLRQPNGRIRLFVESPIWVTAEESADSALRSMTAIIEKYLRQYPEQWLMVRRAWCEDNESRAT